MELTPDLKYLIASAILMFAIVLTGCVLFRIVQWLTPVVVATLALFVPFFSFLDQVSKTSPKAKKVEKPRNKRVTTDYNAVVKRNKTFDEIATIPAYARKAKGIHYPLKREDLNKAKFTVQLSN